MREESVGWVVRNCFCAVEAVGAREEISEGDAEGRVRIGWFVEGEIVVIVSGEGEEVVSPLAGRVEVLSWVIVEGCL